MRWMFTSLLAVGLAWVVPPAGATDASGATNASSPAGEQGVSPFHTTITAEEIQAHGYHTLAEALRWVRGLYVVSDHTYSYVGVRGLQLPGDFNSKVRITIDGHAITGNVYGDGYLGSELGLDMERVERIEVTRGPGTAVQGTNAVLAVVNIVTRRPTRKLGLDVDAWTGGLSERRGAVAIESARPDGPALALSGSWQDGNGFSLYDSGFDPTSEGRIGGGRAAALLGAMEWGGSRLSIKFNERMKPASTDSRDRAYDGHDFVEFSQHQPLGPTFRLLARAWWDGARYRSYTASTDSVAVISVDSGDGDVIGTEWRMDWAESERSTLTAGFEGRYHARAHLLYYDVDPYLIHQEVKANRRVAAFYMQNERRLGRSARMVAGMRVDSYSDFDPVVNPRISLSWSNASAMTVQLAAGSAFRVPTIYERVNADPAAALDPEHLVTFEASLARPAGPFVATLTGYQNSIRDLIDLAVVDTSGTTGYINREQVTTKGVEGELQVGSAAGPQARLALAWQIARDGNSGEELTNSPRWNAQFLVRHAVRRTELGYGLRWLSPRLTGGGTRSDHAVVADTRIDVKVRPSTSLGFEVKNLFNANYGDPVAHAPVRDEVSQEPRAFYVTFKQQAGLLP